MRFNDRMNGFVGVRLADDERRQLEHLARQRGVSISALIRESLPLHPERAAA